MTTKFDKSIFEIKQRLESSIALRSQIQPLLLRLFISSSLHLLLLLVVYNHGN